MNSKKLAAFAIVIIAFIIFTPLHGFSDSIKDGKVTFTNHQLLSNKNIELKGEWDFYWDRFVLPTSFNDELVGLTKFTAILPSSWSKIITPFGATLPDTGIATYRLRIEVPNEKAVYALKLYSVFSSYRLFINQEMIKEIGMIGNSKESTIPRFEIAEVPIPVSFHPGLEHQDLDIVIQVANFHHRRCGLQQPVYFGRMETVVNQTENSIILGLFMVGIILIIGLNHTLMYFLRRNDISNLVFGILCIIMILRNLTTGERVLLHWFPGMSWEWLVRLDNFSGFGTITLFALFFYLLYQKQFPKFAMYTMIGIGLIITALVFLSSAYFYGSFRLLFEIYIGLGGFYLTFFVLLWAGIKREKDAFLTFIGMFFLYTTAVNDVLSSMGVIHTGFLASYGLAAYMIIQSFLLTRKSAFALKANQQLSLELENEKNQLELRIKERTRELSTQASELEKHRQQQEKQHWVNESLNILTEVMRENRQNFEKLADQLLSVMVKRTKSYLGVIYFLEKTSDGDRLKLIAHFGLSKDQMITYLDTQEGLTGHCFTTGQKKFIYDLPDGFFNISSGLGSSKPSGLALLPLTVDEKTIGVVELATFSTFDETKQEFLEKATINIASQLNMLKMNNETQYLLNDYKNYEKELRQKEEDYRRASEELAILKEQLQKQTLN